MNPFRWSSHVAQCVWIYLGLAVLSIGLALATQRCPEDPSTAAQACFTEYSTHYLSVIGSEEKLCCGMHAEILRAFCDSFEKGLNCVSVLRYKCPAETHSQIDKALVNFDGSLPALRELCGNDIIIETYAMHRRCFHEAKYGSESCFRRYFNGTNIDFLTRIAMGNDQFCRKMRSTVHCVEENVRRECGSNAAQLAPILTKPMVAGSAQCDYTVIHSKPKTTTRPSHGHPAYISDEYDVTQAKDRNNRNHRKHSNDGGNSGYDVRASRHVTALTSFTVLLFLLLRCRL